jgi:DivIVA domain-containing protein
MVDTVTAMPGAGGLTAEGLRALRFAPAKGFGRGYDQHEVDEAVARCAAGIEQLTTELAAARTEIATLRARVDQESSAAAVDHAVNVLTTAQRTAEAILAQANQELEKARDEATDRVDQARALAATLQRDAERKAKQHADEADRRAATQEQNATARLTRLTLSADLAQQEIDRESAALQSFRSATHARVEEFLDGVLDQVAEQYGKAHPLAAKAAATARHRTAGTAQQRSTMARGRRGLRLAARSAEAATEGFAATADPGSAPPSGTELPRPREPMQGIHAN